MMVGGDGIVTPPVDPLVRRHRWLAGTGLVGAVFASSCCVLPLALFTLGISGAWMANLYILKPYQPLFMVLAIIAIAVAWFAVRRNTDASCEVGNSIGRSTLIKWFNTLIGIKAVLVLASLLVGLTAVWPLLVPNLP
ncbi:MAG: mercuric transporter MerT family protein [Arenicellales bacterium]|jgi:mercuric ion transport protein|nr:mercuric transporter MerT family protein [Arenicellales bacterium]|tara:strand:+ start:2077 stop:2487 length:411 start_codon:yes stop_codon:yes gene_type:complete